ncbi:MAG TPA: GNAT family N-acetyltransferase [Taishania sp.]|nr:GNAT family N-acetyltransferase [Taishania sp.]
MKGFGLELKPLSLETLELVRNWRNDELVLQFMQFKHYISQEEQLNWFRTLNDAYYFVIYEHETPLGLINIKKIDYEEFSGEAGLFIGNKTFKGTGVALGASVLLLDFAFDRLELRTVGATMHKQNKDAILYNKLLGFEYSKSVDDQFEFWSMSKEKYLQKRKQLVQLINTK